MSEIEKLEKKRADLAGELAGLAVEIDKRTQALGAELLADKDISRGAEELRRLESRRAVLSSAIGQADSKLAELKAARAEIERQAAIEQAQALDLAGLAVMAQFIAAMIRAENLADEIDRLWIAQGNLAAGMGAPEMRLKPLRGWCNYPGGNGRAYRKMLLRSFEESNPEIMLQARELA